MQCGLGNINVIFSYIQDKKITFYQAKSQGDVNIPYKLRTNACGQRKYQGDVNIDIRIFIET